jgi:hydroxymethylpyrimidine pyrophosphatase-like HAD family hydrolase
MTPMASFNGGMVVRPNLSPIEEQTLPITMVDQLVKAIERHKLDVWLYRAANWCIRWRRRVISAAGRSQGARGIRGASVPRCPAIRFCGARFQGGPNAAYSRRRLQ